MARTGFALPVDPLNELGDPETVFRSPAQLTFMRTLIDIIRRMFSRFVDRDTAVPYIHMNTPTGKTYMVEIRDDGTIKTTHIRG